MHDANSIYTFLNSLNYFISIIVLHLDKSLKELSVVDQDQENKIIGKSFSIIDTFDKEVTIIDRIFESYNKLPNAIAVKDQQGSYTYKNLVETAFLISQQIQKYTNGKNVGIGIYLERSFNLVASIIGVLMSGAYYVPLDPNYPKERVTYIISNAELKMIIVDQSYDFYKDYKTIDVSK